MDKFTRDMCQRLTVGDLKPHLDKQLKTMEIKSLLPWLLFVSFLIGSLISKLIN